MKARLEAARIAESVDRDRPLSHHAACFKGTDYMTGLNLAQGCSATQSSTSKWSTSQHPDIDALIAVNGRISDDFIHSGAEVNPWWQVDLGGVHSISEVIIYNRDTFQSRLRHFSVLTSLDGIYWNVAYKKYSDQVFNEYTSKMHSGTAARYVRVRLDGPGPLHFRQCEVFGEPLDPELCEQLLAENAGNNAPPDGRAGKIVQVGDFRIFVDREYDRAIQSSLLSGNYEARERKLIPSILRPTDRVLEVGTAIGSVTMMLAAVVGAQNVVTFDANPAVVKDAIDNFKRNGLRDIVARTGVLKNRSKYTANEEVDFFISRAFWASRLDADINDKNIIGSVKVPAFCLEDEISSRGINVIVCDIEGGEVDLFIGSDLTGIRLVFVETHYWSVGIEATDRMVKYLIDQGFGIDLGISGGHCTVFRRDCETPARPAQMGSKKRARKK